MNQRIDKEYPNCTTCGMKKLKADNALICPNCDTKSVPSGLVSTMKDPGMAGFVKKIIKGTDGKDYEVMVPSDEEIVGDVPTMPQISLQAVTQASRPPITIMKSEDVSIPQIEEEVSERPSLLVKALRLVFEKHPARTMTEFKRLKKVRDQIDKLDFLIQNLKEN